MSDFDIYDDVHSHVYRKMKMMGDLVVECGTSSLSHCYFNIDFNNSIYLCHLTSSLSAYILHTFTKRATGYNAFVYSVTRNKRGRT